MTPFLRKIFFLFTISFFVSDLAAQKIEYSRDASTLAVSWVIDAAVGEDFSQFLFYDAKTGKLKSSFNTTEMPNAMIFSGDSKTLVIGERLLLEKIGVDQSGKYSILDNLLTTENFLVDRKFQEEINAEFLGFALSPDGKTLYKLFPNFLNAYSFPELKFQPEKSRALKLVEGAKTQNHFLAVSRDGSLVVESEYSGNSSALVIKENGRQTAKLPLSEINAEEEEFPFVSGIISQNSETLLLRSTFNSNVTSQLAFWDLKKRASLGKFSHPLLEVGSDEDFFMLDSAAISPDGKKAAVSFKTFDEKSNPVSVVAVYDIASKTSIDVRVKSENGLRFAQAVAFSPDSKQIATLSTVLVPGSLAAKIQVWDAQTGKSVRDF